MYPSHENSISHTTIKQSQGKKTWDIYVIAPCGKKLRSNPEIDKYLSENPDVQIDREVTNTSKPSDLALSGAKIYFLAWNNLLGLCFILASF